MTTALNTILSWYETGDFPTQEQFRASWSSFWHKDEELPISKITGLIQLLERTASAEDFTKHLTDPQAHENVLAKKDASNLADNNVAAWRGKLGVGDIPSNVALVDPQLSQQVYNKEQIENLVMWLDDFVVNGKISADKIDALGLTDLIEANENSLADFVANTDKYEFQKNDFIAIPDAAGSYALFLFKDGEKTNADNYLPTGLTSISIGMVEGLQAALAGKLDKPNTDGSYYITKTGTTVSYKQINTSLQRLLFWDGNKFSESVVFQDPGNSKLGVGTLTPAEALHIIGRLRTSAIVLEENSEALPFQITYNNKKFYGTDSTGQKKQLQFSDYDSEKALWQSFTDAQKTEIKTIINGGVTVSTMSVSRIIPSVITNENKDFFFQFEGANLNIPALQSSVSVCDASNNVLFVIPNAQVTYLTNGINLNLYANFSALPVGNYKFKIDNGVAAYFTNLFVITNSITYIPVGDTTWIEKRYNDIVSANQYNNFTQVYFKIDSNIKPLEADGIAIYNAKWSNKSILSNENFFLKFGISANNVLISASYVIGKLGFTDIANANAVDDILFGINVTGADGGAWRIVFEGSSTTIPNGSNVTVELSRQGNLATITAYGTDYGGNSFKTSRTKIIDVSNSLYFSSIFFNTSNANSYISTTLQQFYKY